MKAVLKYPGAKNSQVMTMTYTMMYFLDGQRFKRIQIFCDLADSVVAAYSRRRR